MNKFKSNLVEINKLSNKWVDFQVRWTNLNDAKNLAWIELNSGMISILNN